MARIVARMKKKIAGLVLLSTVPMLAGLTRLFSLSIGVPRLDDHTRFSADPVTAVLHIIGATVFATVGAFQFVPSLRRRAWHRVAGRVLSVLGLIGAASGAVMALAWEPKVFDSAALTAIRMVVVTAMVSFIVAGFVTARRGDYDAHGAWMTRAYALFLGGGTQFFTAGFTALPFMQPYLSAGIYAAGMGAGWLINALVAEWLLLSPRTAPATRVET